MPSHEIQFRAHQGKQRQFAVAAGVLCLIIGFFWDTADAAHFPSGRTIALAVLAALAVEFRAQLRGVRTLSISQSGVSIERWFGAGVLRIVWSDLARVEVRPSSRGKVWIFRTTSGKRVEWTQRGFEGDKRLQLEETLIGALREHHIRIDSSSSGS